MALTASEIKEMILKILPDAEVQVQDMRGRKPICGKCHFKKIHWQK